MRIKAGTKSKLAGLIEGLTRTGLKIGVPILAVGMAYLFYVLFGPKLHALAKMGPADRAYFHSTVADAITLVKWASLAVIISLTLRFFYEPLAGQVMTLAGAVFYFASGGVMAMATGNAFASVQTYQEVVAELMRVGLLALVPGGVMVARDIWSRVVNRVRTRTGDLLLAGLKRRRIYEQCWNMPLCPDFIREYCPVYIKRKPCWRLHTGCLCDGEGATRAMAQGSTDDKFARSLVQGIDADRQRTNDMSPERRRARCRKCVIYAEHQRQKYRIVSTLTFPAVAVFFWLFYNQLSVICWDLLEKTDRFMSFLAYNPGKAASFASQGHALTILALICVGVSMLSYALRAVEYLIFDLQV